MEMLFLTASPSLLWPDGIRECSEAVKANTSKKKKKENVEGGGGIWGDEKEEGDEDKGRGKFQDKER